MTVLCDEAAKTENAMSWMPAQEPILVLQSQEGALRPCHVGGGLAVTVL